MATLWMEALLVCLEGANIVEPLRRSYPSVADDGQFRGTIRVGTDEVLPAKVDFDVVVIAAPSNRIISEAMYSIQFRGNL